MTIATEATPTILSPTQADFWQVLRQEVQRIAGHREYAFDIETTGLDPRKNLLVSLAFKPVDRRGLYIDVRDANKKMLRTVIAPLFGAGCVLRGHNLQFDLHWMRTFLGLDFHRSMRSYDTLLNELLILGIGTAEAHDRDISMKLQFVAKRYGIDNVSKEERSWFIDLDKRPEWREPLPDVQVAYIRQDVSVVNKLAAAQEAHIEKYGIRFVEDLEARVLPQVAYMRHYGVGIDKVQFDLVLTEVRAETERLEERLHELLDVPILAARKLDYDAKLEPYMAWAALREQAVSAARVEWEEKMRAEGVLLDQEEEQTGAQLVLWEDAPKPKRRKGPKVKPSITWAAAKKAALEQFYIFQGELKKPAPLKEGVNLNSTQQIRVGLSAALSQGLPEGMTITLLSVNRKNLIPYAERDVIKVYMDFSDNNTILERYGNGWFAEHASWVTDTQGLHGHWRIFPGWGQLNAGTGRFASFNPNFQQMPGSKAGAGLRKAFIPAPGHHFVVCDFSNIELRILGDRSGDAVILGAFADKADLHARTAEVMFKLADIEGYRQADDKKEWADSHDIVFGGSYQEIAPGVWDAVGGTRLNKISYRKGAKKLNFMILYGSGVRTLALELRIAERHSKTLMELYKETFNMALSYLNAQSARLSSREARETRRVCAITASGRKRWFDVPKLEFPKNASIEEITKAREKWAAAMSSVRLALANTPIQGTSADITKLAMALWYERYECEEMHMVAVIHDEFIIEVKEGYQDAARAGLRDVMLTAMRYFLTRVELGEVNPLVTDWWQH